MRHAHLIGIAALMALTACAERDIGLRDLRTNSGEPEEFSIVPNKPLEVPETLSALPTPTPGGANRTDQTPLQDAVAVLGGNPARLSPAAGVPASDTAIIRSASRFGRDPAIKQELAAADLEFRRQRSLFTFSVLPTDEYNRAYRRQALDPYRWLEIWRRNDRRTPAAPPEGFE